jgi:integrase
MQAKRNAARRIRVNGRRGIYYRDTPAGRRYEITFLDSDGKRRWRTLNGSLRDAEAALEEVRGKMRRGERVAPSKLTFAAYGETWLASQMQLRPRTREWYEIALRVHLNPCLGHLRLNDVNEDDVLRVISVMREAGKAPWTIRGVLTPLGRILGSAARRGLIPSNPVARLEPGERPKIDGAEMRILDSDGIERLITAAPDRYRALLATAVFTGLRQGELLGLTWADVDLDAGLVRVRKQLDRKGQRVTPKTPQAVREVVLMPALVRTLKAHRESSFARGFAKATDFVFGSEKGTPLHYRNVVRRGLDRALAPADLDEAGGLRFHDLRHTFASLLIAHGMNVVFVSRQLGHSSPNVTLNVYAHLFDRAEHGQRAKDAMEAAFGNVLETADGDKRQTSLAARSLRAL